MATSKSQRTESLARLHEILKYRDGGGRSMTKSDLQSFIRSGGYAWPGGYQCALMMADGECIDARAARENYRQIRRNMAPNDPYARDWIPRGVFIHWEGEPLICADSGREIPSAYSIPENEKD